MYKYLTINSCNIGTLALPDMYALALGRCQIMSTCAALIYIETLDGFDSGNEF